MAEIVDVQRKLHQHAADGGSAQNRRHAREPDHRANGKEGRRRVGIQGLQCAKVFRHARRQGLGFASYGDGLRPGVRWQGFRQVCEARPGANGFRSLC